MASPSGTLMTVLYLTVYTCCFVWTKNGQLLNSKWLRDHSFGLFGIEDDKINATMIFSLYDGVEW
ncbi:hypothetical protein HHI36_017170, partial [Cryptolaemus montrouzieri]